MFICLFDRIVRLIIRRMVFVRFRELEGLIFQSGIRLEELKEEVEQSKPIQSSFEPSFIRPSPDYQEPQPEVLEPCHLPRYYTHIHSSSSSCCSICRRRTIRTISRSVKPRTWRIMDSSSVSRQSPGSVPHPEPVFRSEVTSHSGQSNSNRQDIEDAFPRLFSPLNPKHQRLNTDISHHMDG